MSPAVSIPKCRPSGFIHIRLGNSGSRTEMWPDWPSVNPLRAKKRNVAAMWVSMCRRSATYVGNSGIPFVLYMCEISFVFFFFLACKRDIEQASSFGLHACTLGSVVNLTWHDHAVRYGLLS